MSFDNYINDGRIVIDSDFSENDKNLILLVMRTAYTTSPTAKAMFDQWFANDINNKIIIDFMRGKCRALSNEGLLEIDLSYIDTVIYIDNNGTAVKHTPFTAIMHELVHVLTDKLDDGVGARDWNAATYPNNFTSPENYKGATVIHSNIIYSEVSGLKIPQQNSYIGQDTEGILTPGYQYTRGNEIDRSVVVEDDGDWSTSSLGDSRDLLIGGSGDNWLAAGGGNDY